ncbi:MAG: hypothetical protein M0Z59_04150 [Nitrospiraceae bacterium]|nr:hypothetical protein [Nitrospiraceae bacterium]
MKIAVLTALGRELAPVIKETGAGKAPKKETFSGHMKSFEVRLGGKRIFFVQTGMGVKNAQRASEAVINRFRPDIMISAGFGGAIHAGTGRGSLAHASKVLLFPEKDALEIPGASRIAQKLDNIADKTVFVTLSGWTGKDRLRGFLAHEDAPAVCEMETYPIARASLQKGITFFALRSITDVADEDIPFDPAGISGKGGNVNLSRAILFFSLRPGLIPYMLRLRRASGLAASKLSQALMKLFEAL